VNFPYRELLYIENCTLILMFLHFKTFGTGEPLIILHGLFGTLDNWQTLARQWSAHFTVYALDMRNHGRSPFADTHTYEDLADDIADFMTQNGIEKAHILGHSMGGKAAMQFATMYSERIDRLIIADIAPKDYGGGHETVFDALFAVDLSHNPSRQDVESILRKHIPDDNSTVQFLLKNLTRDIDTGALEWKINIPVLHREYAKIIGSILIYTPIDLPTLFVRGAKSRYIQDADWSYILDYFTDVHLATIPNAGHWVHAENPTDFSIAVLEFLNN
jgi:esterase